MLRFGFLAKKLSRSFLEISSKDLNPKVLVDIKFASSKDLNLFINDIDINKYSLPKLTRSLKISKDNPQELFRETIDRLNQIRDKVIKNLDKLDPQSLVEFCEFIGKSNLWLRSILSKEHKNKLICLINDFLSTHSLYRRQILTIYENLAPQGYKIEKIEYEVHKIVDNETNLKLEEIAQIIIGSDKSIYSRNSKFFYICMKRLSELSNQGQLDEKYLAKILYPLAINIPKRSKITLEKFMKVIEPTLPRWKEDDLLSIIKLYKNNNDIDENLRYLTLERIYTSLSREQPIEFVIKLISLLKEQTNKDKVIKDVILKSIEKISSVLSEKVVSVVNLINILDCMKPIIYYQTAHLLKHQVNRKDWDLWEKLSLLQKASWICVNNDGKLLPLTDIILFDLRYFQNAKSIHQLKNLYLIANTKNHNELHFIKEIKKRIIDDIKIWIASSNENVHDFFLFIDNQIYSSEFVKTLIPLQDILYNLLAKQITSQQSLLYSMILYECDPKKWENFVKENKKFIPHEGILQAIRFYKGPFEAINFLLNVYEHNVSKWWIGAAMERAIEIEDSSVLDNFARILNTIDPYFLLDDPLISSREDCFNHILWHSDFSLLSDLFSKAQELLKSRSIDAIFSKNNIKILYYVALLQNLDTDLADLIISNYGYMKKAERWQILMISSKCSDVKLREEVIKKMINDKLELDFLKIAIDRYSFHPFNEEIDNYIIEVLKDIIPQSGIKGIIAVQKALWRNFELMKTNHPVLLDVMLNLAKDMVLKNIGLLNFYEIDYMRRLFNKRNDPDSAKLIWANLLNGIYDNNYQSFQEKLTDIKSEGLSNKETILNICNKDDKFSSAYIASTISQLADLSLEQEGRANEMAKTLINYVENNKLVFENDLEYTNWMYGLIRFNANKSVVMRHLENSKYFEIEKPTFRHFLLANHFSMDPDYKGINILENKADKYDVIFIILDTLQSICHSSVIYNPNSSKKMLK